MNQDQIKRISFSEFKNWKECPWRHKLIHIDKLEYYSGNEYTAFGSAIHYACEKCVPNNKNNFFEYFQKSFMEEIVKLESADYKIDDSLVSEMKNQGERICNQIMPALKEKFGSFEIFSIEEELLEPIEEFNSYGTSFKGFIDIVIKVNNKYFIIDWKSCSWGWNSRKKSDPTTTYQLVYYKNYFSKKHNIDPENIETYFALLKRTAKNNNVEFVRVTSGQKKTKNSLKVLENAVININKKNYIKNRLSCTYCKFYKTENCT